jgi:hypothetical protein
MRKHAFRPSLNDVLEDRIALSHVGITHASHAHAAASTGHVLKTNTLNDVNRKIDSAFNQFTKEYNKELATAGHTGNTVTFQSDVTASVSRLRTALDKQAARIPGGTQTLVSELNSRVDSLVHDLTSSSASSASNLIRADQSGSHGDIQNFVHNAASKGELSIK